MTAIRKALPLFLFSCFVALSAKCATWTTIDVPGAESTYATGINNGGDIVGLYSKAGKDHGFLLRNGQFTTIDVPQGHNTNVTGINDSGQMSGDYMSKAGSTQGFFFDGQTFTSLSFPHASDTWAFGTNNDGTLVGTFAAFPKLYAFKWANGDFQKLRVPFSRDPSAKGINQSGDIVGDFIGSDNDYHGFILVNGTKFRQIDYPERLNTRLVGLNDQRIITGTLSHRSFKLSLGTDSFGKVNFPGAWSTVAAGINNANQVVGYYLDTNNVWHGFLRVPSQ